MRHDLGKLEVGEKIRFSKGDRIKMRDAAYYQKKAHGKKFAFPPGRFSTIERLPDNTVSEITGIKMEFPVPTPEPVAPRTSSPGFFEIEFSGIKKCIDCGQWLPREAFGTDKATGDHKRAVCAVCFKARDDRRKSKTN